MQWSELCEKAKKMDMLIVEANSMLKEHIWVTDNLCFYEGGNIVFDDVDVESRHIVASELTPDQMFTVMKALRRKESK